MRGKHDRRIALLGGAFDPVHWGHLALARRALRELPVSEVRLVPNGAPPHRSGMRYSWAHRARLCEQAAAEIPRVRAGLEESPGRTRYSADTVRRYRRRGWKIVLVMGADAFAGFHLWRGWRRILRQANIAVARRAGGGAPNAAVRACSREVKNPMLLSEGAGRVLRWKFCPGAVSSTMIRAGAKK